MKRLYFHYVSLNVRSMMQYKTSFFLTVLGQFLVSFQIFLGIFVMFQRFSNVEGFYLQPGAFMFFYHAFGVFPGGNVCQGL